MYIMLYFPRMVNGNEEEKAAFSPGFEADRGEAIARTIGHHRRSRTIITLKQTIKTITHDLRSIASG